MIRLQRSTLLALIAAVLNPSFLLAALNGRDAAHLAADGAKTKPAGLTFAILDFRSNSPGNPELGKQISTILAASLDDLDGFTLIERTQMVPVLAEHKMSLTGDANRDEALQIGRISGVKILITGLVFPSDDGKSIYITASMIGSETTIKHAYYVMGDKDASVFALAVKLAANLRDDLKRRGSKLVAQPIDDPLVALKHALAGRKLPKISVQIHEEDRSRPVVPVAIDPAAQTEVRMLLKDAGLTIIEGDDKALTAADVTLEISGNGFWESAGRIGDLLNCTAHLEMTIKDRKSGEILFSKEITSRAVDLAPQTAGKTALQKAGHALGIEILGYFDKSVPATNPAK